MVPDSFIILQLNRDYYVIIRTIVRNVNRFQIITIIENHNQSKITVPNLCITKSSFLMKIL